MHTSATKNFKENFNVTMCTSQKCAQENEVLLSAGYIVQLCMNGSIERIRKVLIKSEKVVVFILLFITLLHQVERELNHL